MIVRLSSLGLNAQWTIQLLTPLLSTVVGMGVDFMRTRRLSWNYLTHEVQSQAKL
jgi:hypothetical protein